MGPSRAHGPSAGRLFLPEAHGPPKVYGPRGHCTPCPPLGGPGSALKGIPIQNCVIFQIVLDRT